MFLLEVSGGGKCIDEYPSNTKKKAMSQQK